MDDDRILGETEDEKANFAIFEERGEATIRAERAQQSGCVSDTRLETKWLFMKQQQREARMATLAEYSVDAAQISAKAGIAAVRHAKIAWIVSSVGIVVTIAASLIPMFQKAENKNASTVQPKMQPPLAPLGNSAQVIERNSIANKLATSELKSASTRPSSKPAP